MQYTQRNQGTGTVVILVVIAILAIGGVFYYKGAKNQKEALEAPLPPPSEDMVLPPPREATIEIGAEDEILTVPGDSSPAGSSENGSINGTPYVVDGHPLREFAITGQNYAFSVKEMRVKKGDFVHVNFTSNDGMHDWRISEYNKGTEIVTAGKSSSVEFVADKVGTFEFYCGVGSHRAMGMVGKFMVEE
ncbi:MAG: blue (type 1) copper domain-containing protein [Parcubacteria group bacterium Gr01-1014_70]|nr:MAG: blue (type 1) copper domain-containing protein [Parcubacteria group bacterium Gr01-1014_70]